MVQDSRQNGPQIRIGQSLPRREDHRLLTGRGRFTANLPARDALQAVFLRSPAAHARIRSIEVEAARRMPGVAAIFTGEDMMALGMAPMPCLNPIDGMIAPERWALARNHVRHVGEPVALILAETEAQARDALEAIVLDIDDLPSVTDTASGTHCFHWQTGDADACARLFREAAHVVRMETVNNRLAVSPIEPRAVIAEYDAEVGRWRMETQSQGVHFLAQCLAPALSTTPDRLEIFTRDVGGSFGMKLFGFPEQVALLLAAKAMARRLRWVSDRAEAFVSDTHGRDQVYSGELALDAQGRFLAYRVQSKAGMGAYLSAYGPYVPTGGMKRTMGHVYDLKAVHLAVEGVLTNTAPTDAYRGAGKPESVYLLERLIDKAARELGGDRVELRRRNLVPSSAMPYRAASGEIYDSGDFQAPLDAVLNAADWAGFASRRKAAEEAGLKRGIGLGLYLHATGGDASDVVHIRLLPDGMVELDTGLQSSGQGHETVLAQIVADRLDLPLERIRIIQGEGFRVADASTGGSSSMPIGGVTAGRAAEAFLAQARELAADALEVAMADLAYARGAFRVTGTDRVLSLQSLAEDLAAREQTSCAAEAAFEGEHKTFPNGAYVAEILLDPATGQVKLERFTAADDLGVRVNPALAEGQIHGGLAQGIGQALMEHVVHDPASGQLLSGSFLDYALPRSGDLPGFTLVDCGRATANNPLGAKGAGEVGTIGAPAAIMNAIADALGMDAVHMPALPEQIWRLAQRHTD